MDKLRICAHILPFIALITVWIWMGISMRSYTISDEDSSSKIVEKDISGFSWAHGDSRVFNFHPLLNIFGFVFCSSQAALTYGSLPYTHLQNKQLHMILHGVGLLSATIAAIAVFRYHNDQNITNLYSIHSWFGLTLVITMCILYIVSFVTFYYPGAAMSLRNQIAPYHVILGVFMFGLVLATAGSGITERLMFNNSCNLTGIWTNGNSVEGHMAMDCRWGIGLGLILILNFLFLILALMTRHVQMTYNDSNKASNSVSLLSKNSDEQASLLRD
jgi:hypothetical protein